MQRRRTELGYLFALALALASGCGETNSAIGAFDAGSGGGVGSDAECPLNCSISDLAWGTVGGLGGKSLRSRLSRCDYTYTPYACSVKLQCSHEPLLTNLVSAFSDPEVTEAFTSAPITYGSHNFALDLPQVLLSSEGREITLGSASCNGLPDCLDRPDGVQRLLEAIQALDRPLNEECRARLGDE